MNTQTSRVQKLITFSPSLYERAVQRANQLGISFPEYMRHLAVADIKKSIDQKLEPSPYLKKKLQDSEKSEKEDKDSPTFSTGEEAVKWLEKQGI